MKTLSIFSSKNIWSVSIIFVVILSAFLVFPRGAQAAGRGFEGIKFRIDTELDVLNAKGITVQWSCGGGATSGSYNTYQGLVADGVASESTGLVTTADGIVQVTSASAENTGAKGSGCDFGETIIATVSISGWVSRTWTSAAITASAGEGMDYAFTTRASMDYTIVVNGVSDELGTDLTLNGTNASASYDGTVASQSYSSTKLYIAGSTTGGYVAAYRNGYVRKTTTSTLTIGSTASQSVDFGFTGTSTHNETGLLFGVKATVGGTTRSGEAISGVTGRTVTAGDGSLISCTDGGSGNYYCPVLLAETGVIATSDAFRGLGLTLTCTYTDRTAKADTQKSCAINATENSGSGGGGGATYTYETTPTPTPEVTPTPTPVPGLSPTPTPMPVSATLYRKANDPKVYVQGSDGTLSWVKTIEEFNAAGYLWSDVKVISGSEFAQMKISEGTPVATALFRKANDPKVYVQGSDGTLTWVKTIEAFNAAGYRWSDVKMISGTDFAAMKVGGSVRVAKGIAFLRVRSGPSTVNKIVGQVLPGQELRFTEIKNGWYHIDSGWVSGAYAKEF